MPNAQKTITDVGYIAVGLGVMGFQQAQIRVRSARERVSDAVLDAFSRLEAQDQEAHTEWMKALSEGR